MKRSSEVPSVGRLPLSETRSASPSARTKSWFNSPALSPKLDRHDCVARSAEAPLEGPGVLTIDNSGVQVTASGWYLVRAIAMVFDKYLQVDIDRARFSKII